MTLPSSPLLAHAFFAVAAEVVAASDMLISWLLMELKKDVAADEVHTELLSKLKLITSLAEAALPTARGSGSGTSMWNCSPLALGVWSNWKLFCFFACCGWN